MKYCIIETRELTLTEISLLKFLVPGRSEEVANLKVVARCGCGKCPTVLFRQDHELEPLTGESKNLAYYTGKNADGEIVAIDLYERNGEIAELEASSLTGGDINVWPEINSLEKG